MSDAFESWIPTLQDLEVRKQDPDPTIAAYYQRFGWDNIEVPADCPRVAARMSDLKVIFEERYAFRMINSETPERWQIRLQNRFDRFVRVYEHAYELYETYQADLIDDVRAGEVRTWSRSYSETGSASSSSSGTGAEVDTPDAAVNAGDNYADRRTKRTESGSSSDSTSGTDSITETKIKTGESLVTSINEGFRKYVDIDQDFIGQFEDSFLNLFWY